MSRQLSDGLAPYSGLHVYYGDIHNHCGISYGHGSLEEAYTNARLQLDFASVTGHAQWHDMPRDDPRLTQIVDFHEAGFARLAACWNDVRKTTEEFNEPGRFVTFPSFEWHSLRYGDHCVYFNGTEAPLVRASSLETLRSHLRDVRTRGTRVLLIPHHIGYRVGWRGINWDEFTSELSPVVEMMSMHGCGESDDAPRPYLHTMGPRDSGSSMWEGLRRGLVFGVIGSTDHHSAHPGSHGHGRLATWAPELTRTAIWDAIEDRRTYALTGDRIDLQVALNDNPMGATAATSDEREIDVEVAGGGPLDYVEIIRNGQSLHRRSAHETASVEGPAFHGLITLHVGWGPKHEEVDWNVELVVEKGTLLAVEPRFRGADVVSPIGAEGQTYQYSGWEHLGPRRVQFRTRTWGNPTSVTDATQAFALEIRGDAETCVRARINGEDIRYTLPELRSGSRTGHVGGFVSGAYRFERAVHRAEYVWSSRFVDRRASASRDWYSVRVRQRNDQWAWSSPIWVGYA